MLENIRPFLMYYCSHGATYTHKTTVFAIFLYFYLANETTRYFLVHDSTEDLSFSARFNKGYCVACDGYMATV